MNADENQRQSPAVADRRGAGVHAVSTRPETGRTRHEGRSLLTKVPEVTAYFWVIKVLTTGMGETTSDYLAHRLGPIPAVGLAGIALVVALAVQFSVTCGA